MQSYQNIKCHEMSKNYKKQTKQMYKYLFTIFKGGGSRKRQVKDIFGKKFLLAAKDQTIFFDSGVDVSGALSLDAPMFAILKEVFFMNLQL
jgi:hypothetical protein